MKKQFCEYYIGLDVGTSSVGWAVTDPDYKLIRFNGKDMWGIHLFDEGKTAAERRAIRINRRLKNRKKTKNCSIAGAIIRRNQPS